VFPKDLIFNEETGGFEVPLGKAAGLTDDELNAVRQAQLEARQPEDRELARQVYYVTDTLDQEEEAALKACKDSKERLLYLTQLVNQCKEGSRLTYKRIVKQTGIAPAARVSGVAQRPAEDQIDRLCRETESGLSLDILTSRDTTTAVRGDSGNLSNNLTTMQPSKTRVELNMSDKIIADDIEATLSLLPLKNEPKGIFVGPNKLPKFLLLTLQEYWSKKDEPVPLLKYQDEDLLQWIDMVIITIARAIKDIPTKKHKLWVVIMQNPKIMDALPEIERFVRNPAVSYIRLCWEVRTRLGQDSSRADLQEEYGNAKQKEGEQPTDYCSRLNRLRQMAFSTGTDDQENLTYENSWNQHYEVCTKGLINKQLMSEVHRRAPNNQVELREAIKAANLWIKRSIRQGLIPGQGDPRALAGLTNQVSQMAVPTPDKQLTCTHCRRPGHTERDCRLKRATCYNCGEQGHMRRGCKKPIRYTKQGPSIQTLEAPEAGNLSEWEQLQCQVFQAGSC